MSSPPRFLLACAALAATVGAPAVAAAHIQLTSPPPRTLQLKQRPCGIAGSVRGASITVLAPGATLEVRWTETIDHPGHYRVSFDLDGQDFTIPLSYNDTTQNTNVVMDLIPDRAGSQLMYTQMITLPNQTCENCTLQVIQMMTDKPPYDAPTNPASDDIYFQCADIALRIPGGIDAGTDAAVGVDGASNSDGGVGAADLTGGCGCRTSHPQPVGIAALLLALGISTRRRRRN